MKRLMVFVFTLLLTFGVSFVLPATAAAQTQEWTGVCVHRGPEGNVATLQGLQCLIGNVLQVAFTFIGLAGFVMIIVGAFNYMLSGGNSKGVDAARNTITFAVVGFVVSLSAFILINIVASFTGVNIIKEFAIPDSCTLWGEKNGRVCFEGNAEPTDPDDFVPW
jgi:ABC-type Fe3+ transport system permease subunit